MRVFLAGATGVIGRRLVPALVAAGHQVTGMTRSPEKIDALRAAGADPVLADAFDGPALVQAVRVARPDAVVHELTSLPPRINPRTIKRDFVVNDRLRSEGTRNLVNAAQAAGVQRIVAESIAFVYAPGPPGTLHAETDPLYLQVPKSFQRTVRALVDLESSVLGAGGVILRYGYLYGPGSSIAVDGTIAEDLHRRRMPIVGRGRGVWSFIHVDDAVSATIAALDHKGPRVFNIVDDNPAAVSQWLPALAQAVGAKRPWHVPIPVARLLAGSFGVETMTNAQGASNALAKHQLNWQPAYPSWREGFSTALG
jgi:nucleoside-diphosphate-sugar epimerase